MLCNNFYVKPFAKGKNCAITYMYVTISNFHENDFTKKSPIKNHNVKIFNENYVKSTMLQPFGFDFTEKYVCLFKK